MRFLYLFGLVVHGAVPKYTIEERSEVVDLLKGMDPRDLHGIVVSYIIPSERVGREVKRFLEDPANTYEREFEILFDSDVIDSVVEEILDEYHREQEEGAKSGRFRKAAELIGNRREVIEEFKDANERRNQVIQPLGLYAVSRVDLGKMSQRQIWLVFDKLGNVSSEWYHNERDRIIKDLATVGRSRVEHAIQTVEGGYRDQIEPEPFSEWIEFDYDDIWYRSCVRKADRDRLEEMRQEVIAGEFFTSSRGSLLWHLIPDIFLERKDSLINQIKQTNDTEKLRALLMTPLGVSYKRAYTEERRRETRAKDSRRWGANEYWWI